MDLYEAKYILNKNGFLIEKYEDKYIFKNSDQTWFGEFIKRYDAYGNFGSGVKEKVESYSNGTLTFENNYGYLDDDDNMAEFSWFVDAHELFADADDVKKFMSSYKFKQSVKKDKDWTAAEIAKLIHDNGLSIESIIDAYNGEN